MNPESTIVIFVCTYVWDFNYLNYTNLRNKNNITYSSNYTTRNPGWHQLVSIVSLYPCDSEVRWRVESDVKRYEISEFACDARTLKRLHYTAFWPRAIQSADSHTSAYTAVQFWQRLQSRYVQSNTRMQPCVTGTGSNNIAMYARSTGSEHSRRWIINLLCISASDSSTTTALYKSIYLLTYFLGYCARRVIT